MIGSLALDPGSPQDTLVACLQALEEAEATMQVDEVYLISCPDDPSVVAFTSDNAHRKNMVCTIRTTLRSLVSQEISWLGNYNDALVALLSTPPATIQKEVGFTEFQEKATASMRKAVLHSFLEDVPAQSCTHF